ncbi:MAG: DNA gyrase inhibitor YacG [Magnetospirillum sp.]|nr:DNA gyrase inhibitor YacG [Magnetospirillum sp.]
MKPPANSNKPCPICGKPPAEAFKPFCSARCADVDLHRWLGGVYTVASDERPEDGLEGEDE